MIHGGCFCRNVRYSIDDGRYQSVDCHCTMCRHVHAAAYVTWIVVPMKKSGYTAAIPATLKSSKNGTRYFCANCGCHVACISSEHPDVIDVPVGSLDDPESFPPSSEIFSDTRLSWLRSNDP